MGSPADTVSSGSRKSRTRSGCLTCRGRKKKCDEVKPRCAGCRRNQLVCEWPGPASQTRNPDHTAPKKSRGLDYSMALCQPTTRVPPSLPTIHMTEERACILTAHSTRLLSHYFRETASFFAMTPLKDNPFVTVLLPIGYADDLLMHGMLALSGAHLSCKQSEDLGVVAATQTHYSRLINGLRLEIANLDTDDSEKTERLLRVLMIVCYYEAVSGDQQGVLFSHLRASRQLLLSLVEQSPSDLSRSAIDSYALGFSLELYVYLVICNTTLAPYGMTPTRHLPLDDVLLTNLTTSRNFSTFGSLFAGSQELFRLIPEVSQLATERLIEETSPESSHGHSGSLPSAKILHKHSDLYERLSNFQLSPPGHRLTHETKESHAAYTAAAEAFRAALHIYLLCALHGSNILNESASPTSSIYAAMTLHTATLFTHILPLIASQQFTATLMWPIVIAGSIMRHADEREALLSETRSNKIGMRHLALVGEVLELLWEEQEADKRFYGPFGLGLVMDKYGVNIVVA